MEVIHPAIEDYLQAHTSEESPLLQKINRETHLHVLMPNMISGHVQGVTLQFLSQMLCPKRILEIGTFTGYSGICLAQGLSDDGLLYTLDINEELEDRVRGYFEEAGLTDKIHYLIGDATRLIPNLEERFDLVFIDADKRNYSLYFDLIIDKVNPGGFIIADNVLWHGKITRQDIKDKDTEALRAFNQKVQQDKRVSNVILPVRDGLLIARKNQ
ncbi:O-methyltransferase [Rapidithrix thailandica]|uniref:O-methyltransferase n=1 Tax=Rapidithrix thailandica TaxID=413964 RepID=A0AAW9S6N5_9BACT